MKELRKEGSEKKMSQEKKKYRLLFTSIFERKSEL